MALAQVGKRRQRRRRGQPPWCCQGHRGAGRGGGGGGRPLAPPPQPVRSTDRACRTQVQDLNLKPSEEGGRESRKTPLSCGEQTKPQTKNPPASRGSLTQANPGQRCALRAPEPPPTLRSSAEVRCACPAPSPAVRRCPPEARWEREAPLSPQWVSRTAHTSV